jgi:hypothetical protein
MNVFIRGFMVRLYQELEQRILTLMEMIDRELEARR